MNPKKTIIYLTELAHDGFGISLHTFPLGLGTVASYTKKIFGDFIDLHLFRTYEDLIDAVKKEKPDIVGFGYFTWNDYISLLASRVVRKMCPETLIVFGGANISPYAHVITSGFPMDNKEIKVKCNEEIPEDVFKDMAYPVYTDFELLTNYAHIDVIIHGDAEYPFVNITKKFMERHQRYDVREADIPGTSAILENRIRRGPTEELMFDLDVIPSPYISGLFQGFMDKYNPIPQIETMRGCPYKCTFCTIGLHEGKLRRHSFEYTKEEILYLKDHAPNRVLRVADPNWGMVKNDLELAEYIHGLRQETNYPGSLRVYYSAGGPFKRVKQMAVLMKDLLPLNMSFQSLNKGILKEIKRGNMPLPKVREMVEFARENQIATGTELIACLPESSYETFRQSFLEAISLRLDSVYMASLYLCKGSELYTKEAREKYGFKTNFALIGKDATKIDDNYIFEVNEMVVGSNVLNKEQFFQIQQFKLYAHMTYAAGYWKEVTMHCFNYDVSPLQVYDEFVENREAYPNINKILDDFTENVKPLFFETVQDLEVAIAKHVEEHGNVDYFTFTKHERSSIGKFLGTENKYKLIKEFTIAAKNVFNKKADIDKEQKQDFENALDILGGITPDIILSPLIKPEKTIQADLNYDLVAWARDGYEYPLGHYKLNTARTFDFTVRNINEHSHIYERVKNFSDAEKFDYYFKVVVSSNQRRIISYADQVKEKQLVNL